MKIRSGFISNSSSSSYVVVFVRLTELENARDTWSRLAELLLDAHVDDVKGYTLLRNEDWTKEVRLYDHETHERLNQPAFGRILLQYTDDREFGEAQEFIDKLSWTVEQLRGIYPDKKIEIAGSSRFY